MIPPIKIRSLLQLSEILDQNHYPELVEEIKENPAATIRNIIKDPDEAEFNEYEFSTLQQLEEAMRNNGRLIDLFKSDPLNFIQRLAIKTPMPEYNIYRILVSCLCAILILIIIGVLVAWFSKNSREAPTLVTAVACTTLGLLAGIFVSVPGKKMAQGSNNKQ